MGKTSESVFDMMVLLQIKGYLAKDSFSFFEGSKATLWYLGRTIRGVGADETYNEMGFSRKKPFMGGGVEDILSSA